MRRLDPKQEARNDFIRALRRAHPAWTLDELYTEVRKAGLYSKKTVKPDIKTAIHKYLRRLMIEVPLAAREVTSTGIYMMRWNGRTGLVRIVGQPRTGWKILKSNETTAEVRMTGLPDDGSIPPGALLSEPLVISTV